jgi:regulator of sigma E protease
LHVQGQTKPRQSGMEKDNRVDFGNLISGFGSTGFVLVAFVVALSIIVAVHEYGHYIVGRWCGIHAEVFSLGFGPTVYARVDKHGTKWQLAALPFGGYVKFMGDKDAASGIDGATISGLSATERRRTMHGAPLWARVLTVAAGPVFNFILSILIFTAFALWIGIATERNVVGEIKPFPFAGDTLQIGDEITAINGEPTADLAAFTAVAKTVPPAQSVTYSVLRDGQAVDVAGPHPQPAIADAVQPLTAAYDAGLQAGDVVQSVNGTAIWSFDQLRDITGTSDGAPMNLKVWRAGDVIDITLVPRMSDVPKDDGTFETRWLIGLNGSMLFLPETRQSGVFESISYGVSQVGRIISGTFSGIAHIVRGDISTCNLKGPIGIAKTSGAAASMGLETFIWFIAALSTAVGLMNLFPIPVLDGGHLVFHAWEAITRRPPPERVVQVMMMTGFGLIMALMFFSLSRDLIC